MAPTSSIRSSEEETTTASSAVACSSSPPALTAEDFDNEPFYGMFDRHSDDDEESAWSQILLPLPASPRGSIPEASETFQRAMRQLDGIEDVAGRKTITAEKAESGSEKRERKCCQVVKKAASFSASDCQYSSSSDASSKDDLAAEARRRKSMPCMSRGKHVQWADEAGVAALVSVRLIRPRLQPKGEKEEAQVTIPRSILRRLTGIH